MLFRSVDLTLDGIDVGNDQEGGEIVSAIGGKDRDDSRGGGVGVQGDIFNEPVDDESTAADGGDINNGRENGKGGRGKVGVQVPSSDRGDNVKSDTDGGGIKYPPSASSGRKSHSRGEEEGGVTTVLRAWWQERRWQGVQEPPTDGSVSKCSAVDRSRSLAIRLGRRQRKGSRQW